eukprot:6965742-Prymnesium_polylepis.1
MLTSSKDVDAVTSLVPGKPRTASRTSAVSCARVRELAFAIDVTLSPAWGNATSSRARCAREGVPSGKVVISSTKTSTTGRRRDGSNLLPSSRSSPRVGAGWLARITTAMQMP